MPRPDQLDNMATMAIAAGYEAVFKGKVSRPIGRRGWGGGCIVSCLCIVLTFSIHVTVPLREKGRGIGRQLDL